MAAKLKDARIIAVTNQKGGVGKTTTAVNLATALAAVGKRVLVVDIDSQRNASTGLGFHRHSEHPTAYDLLFGDASLEECCWATEVPNLSLVPSSIHLAGAEIELVNASRREFRLRQALRHQRIPYDYVLIDCPPALNLVTLNALTAAHRAIVPLQTEFLALEGLADLMQTIQLVKSSFNAELEVLGIVLTMYDRRSKLSESVEADVREHLGAQVFNTVIPRNVRVSEAPSHGLPVLLYDHRCVGAKAYIDLAREMLRREKKQDAELAAA
ncbi:MAG: ParA family protein [Alphaproteobacteria bacterium]